MSDELVLLDVKNAVCTLTLNRPKALNALNSDILECLGDRIEEIANNSSIRVVVLRGSGEKAFVAGADVKQMLTMTGFEGQAFSRFGQIVMRALSDLPVPTIAAVHGFCLGGGFELALSCDMIWTSDNSTFGFPEVSIGLLPGFAGTQRLSRSVGQNIAQDLILSARKIGAAEASQMGAVARVLPAEGFFDEVQKAAEKIAANAPQALALAKQLVFGAAETDLENGSRAEATAFGLAIASEDSTEGITALLDKRKPEFRAC